MKKMRQLKLNNNGSSIVFVVVTIIFIGLLASLILALSASSMKMKSVDYYSRQNFFEGEEYSNKIYAEIGMNAVGILGEAYTTTMGKLENSSISSEAELNEYLKTLYYKKMLIYMRMATTANVDSFVATPSTVVEIPTSDIRVTDQLKPLLTGMIKDTTAPADPTQPDPQLDIKGKVVCDMQGGQNSDGEYYPTITVNDVHIQYVNPENNFESNYTFDIVVRYPEWDFTYSNPVSSKSDIDTFLDYILISNDAIVFDGVDETINGSIATGDNSIDANNIDENIGIRVVRGSSVTFNTAPAGKYFYEPLEVVATDNLVIESSAVNSSSVWINGGELWVNSVLLKKGTTMDDENNTNGSSFVTSGTTSFIQDDLQLDGDYSTAIIAGGEYLGYSYNATMGANSQNYSSAIIINGNNSRINISNLNRLYVNGLAYIDYVSKNVPYRTGESLAIKGVQDCYLVPDDYMGEGYSNPVSSSKAMTAADQAAMSSKLLNEFFAGSLLDPSEPYITRNYAVKIGNREKNYTFYYLNFLGVSEQKSYVNQILAPYSGTDQVRIDIKERVLKNLSEMNMSTDKFLSVAADVNNIYTAGAIVQAGGGSELGSVDVSASNTAGMIIDSFSFFNRYKLMKSLLVTIIPGNEISTFNDVPCQFLVKKNADDPALYPSTSRSIDNYLLNNSTVENIIDTAKLRQYTAGGTWNNSGHAGREGNITYVDAGTGSAYSINNYTGILVVDGDVEIKGNVEGLVIATGTISVTGNGNLSCNATLVDKILKAEQAYPVDSSTGDGPRSDVFKAYPILNPETLYGDTMEMLRYSDVLSFDNWRKYEDTTTY